MPRPLRALAGEQRTRPARPAAVAAHRHHARRSPRRRAPRGPASSCVPVGADDHRAVLEARRGSWPGSSATSAGSSSGRSRERARAAARPAPRRAAAVAAGEQPRARGSGRRRARRVPASWPAASSAGASSRITCALVPLIPNADTPARRGRPAAGHGMASVQQPTAPGRPVDVRRRLVGVQRRAAARRAAAPCTILMTPGDAGGGLGVADVRLDRAQPQRPVLGRSWP